MVSVMPAAVGGHTIRTLARAHVAMNVLENRDPIVMAVACIIVDVRDVAAVLAAVIEPGRGPRSY